MIESLKPESDSNGEEIASTISAVPAEVRVRGKSLSVPSVTVSGRTVINTGQWLKIAHVRDEDLVEGDTTADPAAFVSVVRRTMRSDVFTFSQRPPDSKAKYAYHTEWENAAALPITTYSHWWQNGAEYSIRKAVNRSKKLGVTVEEARFDDDLVGGIYRMYSQTPVRQGKAFWHYNKEESTLRHELGTYLDRSVFLAAFCDGELIGTLKMTYIGVAATIMQIFSLGQYFDRRPNNALIAKAVEICERDAKQYLIYGSFTYNDVDSSLTEFKRRHGFQPLPLPKYYVPLTYKGRVAIKLGLHRGIVANTPAPLLKHLLRIRRLWYAREVAQQGAS